MLPDFLSLLKQPIPLLALGFGSGLARFAPGTWGTLAAIPFFLLMLLLPAWLYVMVIFLAFFFGIKICQQTADELGVHDHPAIVWDEFVGLWIALLPLVFVEFTWLFLLLGFVLFRFFDIVKPWPISVADKQCQGGLGIMLDDVIAGVFSALLLMIILIIF